jgi:hypothetical protein
MVRSTQSPERVTATWSDSNDSTGQLIKGAVRPKFPSKTFTGDMLESVSIFTKMFGLFWWKAGLWPCLFPTVKDFASEAASGGMFEFLKVLQFRFCSEHVWPIKRRLSFCPTCCSLGLGMDSHASFSQKYSNIFQQIAWVCLWDLWLIHFRKFCIFHQVSIDSQAYQHLPARDPASHWAASYHHLSISPVSLRSIEPEIGASNYQANLSKQGASRFDPHSTRSLQTWRLGSDHFQSPSQGQGLW